MKKLISFAFAVSLAALCLAGCGNTSTQTSQTAQTGSASSDIGSQKQLRIVSTIFPEYDWVRAVLGNQADSAELTLLLDSGVDLHSYQPTANDILTVSNCDVFVYVGGESDEWVEDVLKESTNSDMIAINLLDTLGDSVKTEEVVEGMEAEAEEEKEEDDEPESDEHVWLSLRNAQTLVAAISDALSQVDSDNAEAYQSNASAYNEQLAELDTQYQEAVDNASQKTLLFGDRFPFRYLADDYGLDYYAAFVGCSAETEASFETITFLADKADELGLNSILTIENSDQKIAKTIVENTKTKDQQLLVLDSLQSVTSDDVSAGVTYLSVMQDNLAVLEQALQ